MRSLSRHLFLLWCILSLACANAQQVFHCDTAGMVQKHDSVIIFNCDHFLNILTHKVDSITSGNPASTVSAIIVATIKDNKLNGPVKFMRPDSNVFIQGFMKDGLADSNFVWYSVSLKNYKMPSMKSFFRNGLKEGEETEYNEKGVVTYIRNYHEGKLEGAYKHYDDRGNLITGGTYKADMREDVWTDNYIQEHYSVFSNFIDDELQGYNWKAYYSNGKIFFEGYYDKNGKKQGIFSTYDQSGVLMSTDTYKDGLREGYYTEYMNGKPIKKVKYKHDQVVKE